MRGKSFVVASAFIACMTAGLLFGQARAQPTTPPNPPSTTVHDRRWQQDIQYLVTNLEHLHKGGIVNVSQTDLEKAAAVLEASVPSLSNSEIIVGMMKLVAMLKE